MMLNRFFVLSLGLFMAMPMCAKELSYSGVEFSAASIKYERASGNAKGVSASFELGPVVYIGAGVANASVFGDDQKTTSFGLGVHKALSDTADIYAEYSRVKTEIEDDYDGEVISDTGSVISFGLRNKMTESFELDLGVERVEIFNDSNVGLSIGGHIYLAPKCSVGFGYGVIDDYDVRELALRVYF